MRGKQRCLDKTRRDFACDNICRRTADGHSHTHTRRRPRALLTLCVRYFVLRFFWSIRLYRGNVRSCTVRLSRDVSVTDSGLKYLMIIMPFRLNKVFIYRNALPLERLPECESGVIYNNYFFTTLPLVNYCILRWLFFNSIYMTRVIIVTMPLIFGSNYYPCICFGELIIQQRSWYVLNYFYSIKVNEGFKSASNIVFGTIFMTSKTSYCNKLNFYHQRLLKIK